MKIVVVSRVGSVAVTAFIIATTACGGSSGGGGGGEVDSFLSALCDTAAPCCTKQGKTYDQGKCRALYTALLGDSQYNAAAGQACLDASRAEAATSTTYCEDGFSDATDAKCQGVFTKGASSGSRKPGETCEDDGECASSPEGDVECIFASVKEATVRQCQIQTHGKEGDVCDGEKEVSGSSSSTTSFGSFSNEPPAAKVAICHINEGFFCKASAPSSSSNPNPERTCAKIQPVGGDCETSGSHACEKNAICDFKTKKCIARKAVGEACEGFSSTQCVEKAFCDTTEKKCLAATPKGGACTKNEQCENRSCTNGKCGSSSSVGGTSFICSQ